MGLEGVTMWPFSYFVKNPVSMSLSATLSSRKSNSSCFHDGGLTSNDEIVNFLHETCATDDGIARAVNYLESYKQAVSMVPTEFSRCCTPEHSEGACHTEERKLSHYSSKV